MTKPLIIIPARKNSSFKHKNTFPLREKPLIVWTIETALSTRFDKDILVSTDDPWVVEIASQLGVISVKRPSQLCNDEATLDQVMVFHAEMIPPNHHNFLICLPPTAPLRTSQHVEQAYRLAKESQSQEVSVVSVTEERRMIWASAEGFIKPVVEVTKNRQWENPSYVSNGAIFISTQDLILQFKRKVSGRVIPYVMPQAASVDLHDESDFRLAEFYLNERGS